MLQGESAFRQRTWHALALALAGTGLVAGCATLGSEEGRYLQVVSNGRVVTEIDTGAGGMASCGNQLAMLNTNRAPGMSFKCSPTQTSDPLPFMFRAHQMRRESDGFKPSSPYWVRTDTKLRCTRVRNDTAKQEKTVILDDRCA